MIRCDWWRQQRPVGVETNVLARARKKRIMEVMDRRERFRGAGRSST
jgi:hypothetical protein